MSDQRNIDQEAEDKGRKYASIDRIGECALYLSKVIERTRLCMRVSSSVKVPNGLEGRGQCCSFSIGAFPPP